MTNLMKYLIALLVLNSCIQNNEAKQLNLEIITANNYWINKNYLNCLEKNLPSDCIETGFVFAFKLDSLFGIEIYDNEIEPYYSRIFSQSGKYYFLKNTDTVELEFNSKSTEIIINSTRFVSDNNWNNYDDINFVNNIAGTILYKSFNSDIKELFDKDKVSIAYNPYYNIHFISDRKECSYTKIIELSTDSISIYNILNGCDSKSSNHTFDKELLIKSKRY